VLAELGESARAIEDLDIALRIAETAPKPDDSWRNWCKHVEAFARRGRGVALATSGQIPLAMKEFDASITLSPDNACVYLSRAALYERIGDVDRALIDYRTSLEKTAPPLTPLQKDRAQAKIQAADKS